MGVPLWLSGLRIQHHHCSGSGLSCGSGLDPWPWNTDMAWVKRKKKERENDDANREHFLNSLLAFLRGYHYEPHFSAKLNRGTEEWSHPSRIIHLEKVVAGAQSYSHPRPKPVTPTTILRDSLPLAAVTNYTNSVA